MRSRRSARLAALLLLAVLPACGAGPASQRVQPVATTIRFAAYDFSENQILAAVYAEGARRAGLPVSLQQGGTREVLQPALQQGVVDVVVDYLGTALTFDAPGGSPGGRSPGELHEALAAALEGHGVTVLDAAAAEDQNGFAVSTAFAAAHHLTRLSELAPIAAGLTFGGPPECRDRPLCLPGLTAAYGLHFSRVQNMPSRAATVEALVAGEIDVGLLETTDARLGAAPVRLLVDDRALEPHENVVPLVRSGALARWGSRLRAALDGVSRRLTTADLVGLNRSVEVDGRTPAEAAARWWSGG